MKHITTIITLFILCFTAVHAQEYLVSKWRSNNVGTLAHFNKIGTKLLTCGKNGLDVWDIKADTLLFRFTNALDISDAIFNDGGDRIAISTQGGRIFMINAANGNIIHEIIDGSVKFEKVVFSKNDDLLLGITDTNIACVWHIHSGLLASKIYTNGRKILSGSFTKHGQYILLRMNGYAVMYDSYSGEVVSTFEHPGNLLLAKFIRNDERIITVSDSTEVKVWVANSMSNDFDYKLYASYAEVSDDGNYLLSVHGGTNIIVRDVNNGKQISVLADTGLIISAHFSATGEYIISTAYNGTAKLWHVKTGKLSYTFRLQSNHFAEHCEFDITGKRFLTASSMGCAVIWDIKEQQYIFERYGYSDKYSYNLFSPSDENIITCSNDGSVKVWNAKTGALKLLEFRFLHYNYSRHEKICSDNTFISGSAEHTLRVMDGNSLETVYDIPTVNYPPTVLPNCKQIAYPSETRHEIKVYDLELDSVIKTIHHDKVLFSRVIVNPTGDVAATFSDSTLYIVSLKNGVLLDSLKIKNVYYEFIDFVDDNTILLKIKYPDKLVWVNTALGEIIREIVPTQKVEYYTRLSRDKSKVVIIDGSKIMRIWDAKNGTLLKEVPMKNLVSYVDFDKNGKYVLTIEDRKFHIYNFSTMEKLAQALWPSPFSTAEFNNKATQVVTSDNDGTIRVWDTDFLEQSTGIGEYNNTQEFTISPNPATDEITIKGISSASSITYTFTDIIGNTIHRGFIPEQTNTYTLSTQHLPSGFYNVTFQMNGTKHTEKLTVVH